MYRNGDIPKAQKLLLDSKNWSFFGKDPFFGPKNEIFNFFQESGQMGAFDECESNGDIPKAQKLLLDSKNSSFFGKNAFFGPKNKIFNFFQESG